MCWNRGVGKMREWRMWEYILGVRVKCGRKMWNSVANRRLNPPPVEPVVM